MHGGKIPTTDHGVTWSDISGDLPDAPVSAITIDPRQSSTLYAGTDVGVFVSQNLGASWAPLGVGLPDTNAAGRRPAGWCRARDLPGRLATAP